MFRDSQPEWGGKRDKRARTIPGRPGAGQSPGAAHPCVPQPLLAGLRGVSLASPLPSASLPLTISETNYFWEQEQVFCSFLRQPGGLSLPTLLCSDSRDGRAKGPRCPTRVGGTGPDPQSAWREPLCSSVLPKDVPGAPASVSPAGTLGRFLLPSHTQGQD